MKNIFIMFGMLLFFNSLKAQGYIDTVNYAAYIHIGLRIEINEIREERITGIENEPSYGSGFFSYSYVFPFSVYVPIKFDILKDWRFELRPGILFYGEQLTSFVFGLNGYYYPFDNSFYTVFGFQNSKHMNPLSFNAREETRSGNFYYNGITAHNDDEWHTSILFGAGYELGKVVSVDLSMALPFQQRYGWHDVADKYNAIDPPDGRYPMKLFYMAKFGINFFIL